MSRIQKIYGRQVFDSKGNPVLEVEVTIPQGTFRATVPSGEHDLRDGDNKFMGKGVSKCVDYINLDIAQALTDMDPANQYAIDEVLTSIDSSEDNVKIGANSILAVSMACCRAAAAKKNIPLYKHINNLAGNPQMCIPVPYMNMMSGGLLADNQMAFEGINLIPIGARNFPEAMQVCTEIFHQLEGIIKSKYNLNVVQLSEEGGFAAPLTDVMEGIELLNQAIELTNFSEIASIGIDAGASKFYDADIGKYNLDFKNPKGTRLKSSSEMIRMYKEICAMCNCVSIEDPFHNDDATSYAQLCKEVGDFVQIAGDDYCWNKPNQIDSALENKYCNSIVLEINRVTTMTEFFELFEQTRGENWGCIVSHCPAETDDTFIADLVVGLGSGQFKGGGPSRVDYIGKYNQLLRIDEISEKRAQYAGEYFRDPWMITPR